MHNISLPELLLRRTISALTPESRKIPKAIGDRALGLDLSVYDGAFVPSLATKPIDFAIQRISFGLSADTYLDSIWSGVSQIPVRGGYHYLKSYLPWQQQADFFIQQSLKHDYQFLCCDFEGYGNTMTSAFCVDCYKFLDYISSVTGKPAVCYYNVSTANEILFKYAPQVANFPMWIAQWPYVMPDPTTATPKTPTSKSDWTLWQYSADGNLQGKYYGVQSRDVDLDVFNGTVAEMRSWLGISDATPYTTEEKVDIMWDWGVDTGNWTNP